MKNGESLRLIAATLVLTGCALYEPNPHPASHHWPAARTVYPHQVELDRDVEFARTWTSANAEAILRAANPGMEAIQIVELRKPVVERDELIAVVRMPAVIGFERLGDVDGRGQRRRSRKPVAFNYAFQWVQDQWERINVKSVGYELPECEPAAGRAGTEHVARAYLNGIAGLFGPQSHPILPTARWEVLGTGVPVP